MQPKATKPYGGLAGVVPLTGSYGMPGLGPGAGFSPDGLDATRTSAGGGSGSKSKGTGAKSSGDDAEDEPQADGGKRPRISRKVCLCQLVSLTKHPLVMPIE